MPDDQFVIKFCNQIDSKFEKSKSEYYIKLLEDCKGDSSKLWKAFKVLPNKLDVTPSTLKSDDGPCNTALAIANGFNHFFY